MFGIGMQEFLIILIVALVVLVLGTDKIPEIGRALGKAVSEFRQTKEGIEKEVKEVTGDMPLRMNRLFDIMKMITRRRM